MKNKPVIRIEIDPSCHIPEVIIRTDQKTALIEDIVSAVEQCSGKERSRIMAYRDGVFTLLDQRDILRIYTEERKLIVSTETGDYEVRSTLRELEEALDAKWFQRISRFEIINLNKVTGFDFGVSGTIKVSFVDGSSTWVSRRYIRTIEQVLVGAAAAKEEKR